MKRAYLDTSALRHLLILHASTAEVTSAMTDPEATTATSHITVTELHRLGMREPNLSTQDVDAVLDSLDFVAVSEEQLRAAGLLPDLASGVQLRSLDAVHIQAALDFGATEFFTSDRRQAEAARAAHLSVRLVAS